MFIIRHSIRTATQSTRTALVARAIPSTGEYFSSSSISAGREHDGHDVCGAPTGPQTPSEVREEACDIAFRKDDLEVLLVDLGLQAAPDLAPQQPERSGTTPATAPQPAPGRQILDGRRDPTSQGKRSYFRFVRIFGLSADMTLADILKGIADTAPVGRVLHVEWEKRGIITHRGMQVGAAFVLFDSDAAAADLVRLAKQQVFLIRGESVYVRIWTNVGFHGNVGREASSRVIHIRGPQEVEGFNEEGIRNLVMGNNRLVKTLGPLGLDAEAVVTRQLGGGKRLIEWRFFSNEKQAQPVLFILRRAFYKMLFVGPGPDPCWNEDLYPRGRTSTQYARHLPAIRKPFMWPSVRGREHTSSDKDTHPSLERRSTKFTKERDQMPRGAGRNDCEHVDPLVEKLYGRRRSTLPLNQRQEERISAWTQINQLPETDAQHHHGHGHRQRGSMRKPHYSGDEQNSERAEANSLPDEEDPFEQVF